MRLRLGFAVAAHLESEILVVDEVLAVGDAEFQRKCLDAMGELHSGGRTVLFVSHNMAAVENLCTRVVWIDGGTVRMDGATSEVVAAYMASFSKSADGDQDLSEVEPRRGTGQVRYTGIRFLGPSGDKVSLIRSGDRLRVRLEYEAHKRVENPHFGLSIHSDMGTLVTDTSTWALGLDTPVMEPGKGTVELMIEALNLMPGRYYISLWIEAVGDIRFDGLDHCLSLDIEGANLYGSGRGIDRHFGLVVLPCKWTLDHRTT
jgi:hypothetical protein